MKKEISEQADVSTDVVRKPQEVEERRLPVGIGGVELKKDRKTLPAIEVANEVSWVNNKMSLPFNLKVGESSRLGMFLTPNPQKGESTYNLEVSGSHTRSGILGRVIFSDKEGRLYRDIDLKGTGYVIGDYYRGVKKVGPIVESHDRISGGSSFSSFKGTTGIVNEELIRRDINFSEKFLKAGIRTHRVIAILELKEVIDNNGNKISIAEAKKIGILSEKDEPVIEVRAFGVRSRIHDVIDDLRGRDFLRAYESSRLLSDAKNIVAQELNIEPDKFTNNDYFDWLIITTAINMARMHYNKWVNGYVTAHNLTLDGRIVDLDSVETIAEHERRQKGDIGKSKSFEDDQFSASDALEQLIRLFRRETQEEYSFGDAMKIEDPQSYFNNEYNAELVRLTTQKVRRVRN